MKNTFLTIVLVVFSAINTYAQFKFDNIALHHLNIIDVNTKQIIKNQTIVIHYNKIAAILPTKNYIENDSTHSIILKDKYVLPGLIDAHVHFATNPTVERRDNAEQVLKEMLLTGITSVRDMAGDTRALSSLARNTLVGDIDGPNIYYSSLMAGPEFFSDLRTIATAQGGISGKMPYMKSIDNSSNLTLDVAQAKGTGAAGIKLYANLSKQEIKKIVKEAKKQKMNVWAHAALSPTKPSEIISSGVISISHVDMLLYEYFESRKELIAKWEIPENETRNTQYWDNEFEQLEFSELYKLMIVNNVVLDATMTVYENYKDSPRLTWRYELAKRIINQAYNNGVLIAAGSDSDQKTFVQHEMKLLVNKCEFKPIDAIISATKHSAMATGILESEGSIETGKNANLLLLHSNPIENIESIESVFMVVKKGKLYNPY
ncbi:amidohydrolase family protein [Urechidicola vernalis]|uniref:Amidohydrolase family protein n=1 Tax=Urechidicola vernalis TaxID=3075600 RepID=A0ABU2Y1Q0_9FLAO|nr:amidohydrolase family protein [Urechidicola sp. P050]MDT0552138.1 amidohydrolase family protein [Urechidicola sp. P050]